MSTAPGVTWGLVSATAPLTVVFAGDTVGVVVQNRASHYVPALNDKVILMKVGSQWVAVGKVVSA